ncbi:MAG TPA: succinyldiaminopimelate transaminase [Campylobacterales bacterium]|nr:succinyldiaminopimelate transaminase [Campylobacterales bacterium]
MNFEAYPFEKLTSLLEDITPNSDYEPLTLTIGEPQFQTPDFIQKTLQDASGLLNKYPKTAGEAILKDAQKEFVKKRFGITLENNQIIPTFGTREVLFNFPQFLLHDKKEPVMAFTNPFYQIYEGAAIASRAKIIHLDLTKENNFKAEINPTQLKECDLVVINFPNNPCTSSLTLKELSKWAKAAVDYDFVLINDECYSEIYNDKPDPSLLEAAKHVGNESFKNILIINSISKRSSAPGLRSGFIAGDANILKAYTKYRTYIGCASPLPLQHAAAAAWSDEAHVEENREKYRKSFALAKEILGIKIPKSTFYIWLEVEDDLEFTKLLFKEKNLKVLPGSYLSRGDFNTKHVRIALVENEEKTKDALLRISEYVK